MSRPLISKDFTNRLVGRKRQKDEIMNNLHLNFPFFSVGFGVPAMTLAPFLSFPFLSFFKDFLKLKLILPKAFKDTKYKEL